VFLSPTEAALFELEIKKSRFITEAKPIDSREQALEFVRQKKVEFPDARHHCWAYIVGSPQNPLLIAMSDDGEPSGTAGKPILNAIQGKGVGNIVIVVTRYFGGVKLGAGGLIRAYGGAAAKLIDTLQLREIHTFKEFTFSAGFEFEQPLRHWLGLHEGELKSADYAQVVVFTVAVMEAYVEDLKMFLSARGATPIAGFE
jgi:uncharacterized YigZ family protein